VNLLTLLQQSLPLLVAVGALVGLIVGSFLNVVIYRTPLMLMRRWKLDCAELTGSHSEDDAGERFNLLVPRSRCPNCGHAITAIENIPVISYLWLRGRCSACKSPISRRYPSIELLTAVLTAVTIWKMGYGASTIAAVALTWLLIALAIIDIDHHLLPDVMVLPFLWLGLLLNVNGMFTSLSSAVIGAAGGYLTLWIIFQLFKLLTGKEGMGYGDFKLFALFGAWFGWQSLLLILLMSSFVGAVIGVGLIAFRGHQRSQPLPFGPYLALAGWVTMLWGDSMIHAYLQIMRVSS